MYCYKQISPDLYWIGGSDRRLALFENVYPLTNGVAYNSYVLLDEKIVVFDTVDKEISARYFDNLAALLKDKSPDFLVVHHMEPDHAACIAEFLLRYPDVTIVCNAKTQAMIAEFFGAKAALNVRTVTEQDTLETGRHSFRFVFAPMVHWPEVMVSFDVTDGTLFSADAFGTFGALDGNLFCERKASRGAALLRKYSGKIRRARSGAAQKSGSPARKNRMSSARSRMARKYSVVC